MRPAASVASQKLYERGNEKNLWDSIATLLFFPGMTEKRESKNTLRDWEPRGIDNLAWCGKLHFLMRHTRKTCITKLTFLTTFSRTEINYIPFQSFLGGKKIAWQKSGSVLFQKMLKLYVGLLISDQARMSRHEETLWIGRRMCRQPPIQQLHGLESIRHAVWLWLNPLKFWKVSAERQQSSRLHLGGSKTAPALPMWLLKT